MLFAAEGQGGGGYTLLIMFALLFGAMYFLMIRPQQRRRRQVSEMQSALGVGEEVVTVGGLYGVVRELDDDTVVLEVSPGVTNRYSRGAIGQVLTAKSPAAETGHPETETSDTPNRVDTTKKIVDTD